MTQQNLDATKEPISSERIKELKAMTKESRDYNFTLHLYFQRERLVGEADFTTVDYYLENIPTDLNMETQRGGNLVYFAIDSYAPAVLKYLLDKGVSTEGQLLDGLTPLAFAEKTLENALEMGRKPRGYIIQCIKQTIEILKAHEGKMVLQDN